MGDRLTTKVLAKGRWNEIFKALGVPAKIINGKPQPCPFCGGRDRFQWKNYEGTGGFICRHCGNGDGFELLKRLHGWTFREAAKQVDAVLGHNWRVSMSPENRPPFNEIDTPPKSVRDCALWLRKHHPDRLEAWLADREVEVRWWLQGQENTK